MASPTDFDTGREFRLAAAILTVVALAFAAVGIGAVAIAMPDDASATPAVERPGPRTEAPPVTTIPATTLPPAAPAAEDPNAPVVIKVEMGEFFFSPNRITVPAGRLIRFEVENPGVAPHEFLIGDKHAQDDAEREMAKGSTAGGHTHDNSASIYLEAGESGVLETTFDEPAELILGCHVPGHWAAGMKGTLSVTR